jgi:hypothetical protein
MVPRRNARTSRESVTAEQMATATIEASAPKTPPLSQSGPGRSETSQPV